MNNNVSKRAHEDDQEDKNSHNDDSISDESSNNENYDRIVIMIFSRTSFLQIFKLFQNRNHRKKRLKNFQRANHQIEKSHQNEAHQTKMMKTSTNHLKERMKKTNRKTMTKM